MKLWILLVFLSTCEFGFLKAQESPSSLQGVHKELETDAGEIRIGVSELNTDQEQLKTTGVSEIGYVIRGEYGEFVPRSIALIPFFRSHFESDEFEKNPNARSGIGIDLQFAKLGESSTIVLRATLDESDPYYDEEDDRLRTAIGVFFEKRFGGVDEENRMSQRIRRMVEPVPINLNLSEQFLKEEIKSPEERKQFHFLVVSSYILSVRAAKIEYGIHDYDPFLDPESKRKDRDRWLLDHLTKRYPLFYMFETESGYSSFRFSSYENESAPELLDGMQLTDDFESLYVEQLSLGNAHN